MIKSAKLLVLSVFLASSLQSIGQQQGQTGTPALVMKDGVADLMVDGQPFIILGGQAGNSGASNLADVDRVYSVLNQIHANTAEIPISWNLLEPQPGKYDYSLVDGAIEHARTHKLHLIFLWFGTTKNATLSYVPSWIKIDRTKYFRVRNAYGRETEAISPFCVAALKEDQTAFSGLMNHIKEFDGRDHTVLMMQVENETGMLGTDRDYSSEGSRYFEEQVPSEVIDYVQGHKASLRRPLQAALAAPQAHTRGTWTEVFGDAAPEAFSAWAVSRYVDAVASAGKAAYGLPMYVNVALMNTGSVRPGDWPSGGPAPNVIDIWKAVAHHIDILAPDIYRVDFPEIAQIYARKDNPLYIPETGLGPYYAPYVFTTLAEFGGIGFAPFGVGRRSPDGQLGPAASAFEENYQVLEPLLPLIVNGRHRGTLFPIVLNMYRHESVAIPLGDSLDAVVHFDETFAADPNAHRAGGIIVKLTKDQYVVAGEGFHVEFVELRGPRRNAEFISIEKGTFNDGVWVREQALNGDEESVTLRPHNPSILLVKLNR